MRLHICLEEDSCPICIKYINELDDKRRTVTVKLDNSGRLGTISDMNVENARKIT